MSTFSFVFDNEICICDNRIYGQIVNAIRQCNLSEFISELLSAVPNDWQYDSDNVINHFLEDSQFSVIDHSTTDDSGCLHFITKCNNVVTHVCQICV